SDVDEVVGDDAEADPTVHADETLVAAAVEAVSALDDADAPLASGAPLLAVAEPALLLFALALGAFGRAIGNANPFDAHRFGGRLVLGRVEAGIPGDQAWHAAQLGAMAFDGVDQQVGIAGSPLVDLIVDDDLILGFLARAGGKLLSLFPAISVIRRIARV